LSVLVALPPINPKSVHSILENERQPWWGKSDSASPGASFPELGGGVGWGGGVTGSKVSGDGQEGRRLAHLY